MWPLKAEHGKLQHMRRYLNYKFTPAAPRTTKPRKGNVKRAGGDEVLRCRRVADLLLVGKEGHLPELLVMEEVEGNDDYETDDHQTPLEAARLHRKELSGII